jgi:hypothetical protein
VAPPSESEIRTLLARYFDLLQTHASAEEMRARTVTSDFESGFVSGLRWNVEDFLAARAGFVDERHEVGVIANVTSTSADEVHFESRLKFFLRDPGSGEELTGVAFHAWRLRQTAPGEWRVASQLVVRFEDLNESAARLFSTPDEGLNR